LEGGEDKTEEGGIDASHPDDEDSGGDEPIFDIVTGSYVARKKKTEVDLTQEVGGGQVTTFKSEVRKQISGVAVIRYYQQSRI
jgi:hypothetical protein